MMVSDPLSDKELADKAYNNEQLQTNTERKLQLLEHFRYAESELAKTGSLQPQFEMPNYSSKNRVIYIFLWGKSINEQNFIFY